MLLIRECKKSSSNPLPKFDKVLKTATHWSEKTQNVHKKPKHAYKHLLQTANIESVIYILY